MSEKIETILDCRDALCELSRCQALVAVSIDLLLSSSSQDQGIDDALYLLGLYRDYDVRATLDHVDGALRKIGQESLL